MLCHWFKSQNHTFISYRIRSIYNKWCESFSFLPYLAHKMYEETERKNIQNTFVETKIDLWGYSMLFPLNFSSIGTYLNCNITFSSLRVFCTVTMEIPKENLRRHFLEYFSIFFRRISQVSQPFSNQLFLLKLILQRRPNFLLLQKKRKMFSKGGEYWSMECCSNLFQLDE